LGLIAINRPSRQGTPDLHTPEGASLWFVRRLRARTPSGAIEYLTAASDYEEMEARRKLALSLSNLFREFFLRQHHFCPAPLFSLEREHEFYRLVSQCLFPLDLTPVLHNRDWMYPVIPIRCQQPHDWLNRDYDFEELESPFQIVHAFFDVDNEGFWRKLSGLYNLPASLKPAPFSRVNANTFMGRCVSQKTLLMHLPVAVVMQTYGTGSAWLDCPPGAMMGMSWTSGDVRKLAAHWTVALKMFQAIHALSRWIDESPVERISLAVALWNSSAN
jgi:hypothetical protein